MTDRSTLPRQSGAAMASPSGRMLDLASELAQAGVQAETIVRRTGLTAAQVREVQERVGRRKRR